MTVDNLKLLSNLAFGIAVFIALLAIVMFFVFDIRKIIGDLTGINAKKAIKKIRKQNEEAEDAASKKLRIDKKTSKTKNKSEEDDEPTSLLSDDNQTTILNEIDATTVLSEEAVTSVLAENNNHTAKLNTDLKRDPGFRVVSELKFTQSKEYIK